MSPIRFQLRKEGNHELGLGEKAYPNPTAFAPYSILDLPFSSIIDGFIKSPTSVRQAVRQAHGPEQSRRTHGPEQGRRTALHCILRHCSVR